MKSSTLTVALTAAALAVMIVTGLQARALASARVALEVARAAPALSRSHRLVNANKIDVTTSANAEIVADLEGESGVTVAGFSCVVPTGTDIDTAAEGIYVVDEDDSDTTDGYGPFCNVTSECPLGAIIAIDAGRAWVRKASGNTVSLRCGLGIQ